MHVPFHFTCSFTKWQSLIFNYAALRAVSNEKTYLKSPHIFDTIMKRNERASILKLTPKSYDNKGVDNEQGKETTGHTADKDFEADKTGNEGTDQ